MAGELPRLQVTLAYGDILDVGLEHYGEFIVTPDYATYLLDGGMSSVDGRPGRLTVIQRYENAVQLRWVFEVRAAEAAPPQLRRVA